MLTKRNLCIATGAAALICIAGAMAYAKGNSAQTFVTKAAIANQFEIESSQIALEKSQNEDIRQFAQQMVDDHTKTGDKLENILETSNSKAEIPNDLDDKHQRLMAKLEAAKGADFDRQYVSIQTDAHKEAVSLFSDYAKNGKDKTLQDFAAQTLPTLREHLKHVQQLKNKK